MQFRINLLPFSPIDIIAAQAPAINPPGLLPAIVGEIYSPPVHSVTEQTRKHKRHYKALFKLLNKTQYSCLTRQSNLSDFQPKVLLATDIYLI